MPFSFTDVFSRARLKTQEVADLLGVTRVTVSKYKNGGLPHRLMERRIKRFVVAVQSAVDAQELPLRDVPREERMKKLTAVLRRHMPDN